MSTRKQTLTGRAFAGAGVAVLLLPVAMLSWWAAGDGWELEAAALRAFGAVCFAVVALVVYGVLRLLRESRRPDYFPADAFRGHTVIFAPTRTGMSGHFQKPKE